MTITTGNDLLANRCPSKRLGYTFLHGRAHTATHNGRSLISGGFGMRFIRKAGLARRAALALIGASLVLAATGQALAQAAAPRRIAVVSLLGNTITAVTQASVTGTRIDRNAQNSFAVPNNLFDVVALGTLNEALAKADATATVLPLKLPSADMFGDTNKLFDNGQFVMPVALAPTLKQIAATHLLVVTRWRAPTNIKTDREGIGSGTLEGLGFYVDYDLEIRNSESGERRVGYLAPYTYFKLWWVNLATCAVERSQQVARAEVLLSNRREGVGDPWEVLSSVEKVTVLRDQLTARLKEAVPGLLTAP